MERSLPPERRRSCVMKRLAMVLAPPSAAICTVFTGKTTPVPRAVSLPINRLGWLKLGLLLIVQAPDRPLLLPDRTNPPAACLERSAAPDRLAEMIASTSNSLVSLVVKVRA